LNAVAEAACAAQNAARRSYGKLVAILASRTRDVAAAEDALSEAFAAALVDWAAHGIPDSPEAWLLTAARRRAIDAMRRQSRDGAVADDLLLIRGDSVSPAEVRDWPDRRLGLLFACTHPAIDAAIRAPLMLQTVLGFDAATIASAFLVSPATMGQRLARAKAKIRNAGIAFEVPERPLPRERVDAVLEAIYAAYAEGWSDPQGADARRRNLADEAIWLGRLVAALMPEEGEALGLLALILHAHARRDARRDEAGRFVPLATQDPSQWDAAAIDEAESLLQQAMRCGGIGRYRLEAAVQSAHAIRRHGVAADWRAIERLYDALCSLTGSPVAALNRAVAVAESRGTAAGLAALDALADEPRLRDYQPYWAARAELLARNGRPEEAQAAYQRAIGLERDEAVRRFLQERARPT
jgi:RNA polymerase sigma-70 factor (ECF subfamily)